VPCIGCGFRECFTDTLVRILSPSLFDSLIHDLLREKKRACAHTRGSVPTCLCVCVLSIALALSLLRFLSLALFLLRSRFACAITVAATFAFTHMVAIHSTFYDVCIYAHTHMYVHIFIRIYVFMYLYSLVFIR